jgi:putative radical SAM enzyme (TIGR03279 family)
VRKKDGEEWLFEVEKEYDEDIGIEFEKPIMDGAKRCANKCIFCFIDQLPTGMRETLYFKDDDSRLSFLQGNFITMTNMTENDIERIIRYRISPLNISVHTTDPELRIRMLGNKRAGNILDILKRLVENGISINCQIVLCRDVNDRDVLRETINDLYLLSPGIRNVAVVPVGITRYRDNLYPLKPFDRESASEVVELIEELQHKIRKAAGEIFVRAADEFYIMAGKPLPGPEHYGDYEQLEDGVGMVTNFLENVRNSLKKLDLEEYRGGFSVVTGVSASKYLKDVCSEIEQKLRGLKIDVHVIENNFFGGRITVSGLLTGQDIINQLEGRDLGKAVLIPSNLLKSGERVLLDDATVEGLEERLGTEIRVLDFDGSDFVQRIIE